MTIHYSVIFIVALIISFFVSRYVSFARFPLIKKLLIGWMALLLVLTVSSIFFNPASLFGVKAASWEAKHLQYSELHKLSKGASQRIALIDSGVADFQIAPGSQQATSLTGESVDRNGHGTIMYSLIKGHADWLTGIAPNAEILSIKVIDKDEKIEPAKITEAIRIAIDKKATVINLSIGSHIRNEETRSAIQDALASGITLVASSGDYAQADMMFPASETGVISVGSISANQQASNFTNAPDMTTINAPGDEISSMTLARKIESTSGTSQASAIISGYVALLKDVAKQQGAVISNEQVISLLKGIQAKKMTYAETLRSLTYK